MGRPVGSGGLGAALVLLGVGCSFPEYEVSGVPVLPPDASAEEVGGVDTGAPDTRVDDAMDAAREAAPEVEEGGLGGDACADGGDARACDLVFSAAAPASGVAPVTLGTIPGVAGKRIHVVRVGICGDSDATSGPNRFAAKDGAALTFSWSSGQKPLASTYTLAPTPVLSPGSPERGFSYQTVDHTAAPGLAVTVDWDSHLDWDGLFCATSDELGNGYKDLPSTVRAWVRYRYE